MSIKQEQIKILACKCDQIGHRLKAKQGCSLSQIDSQLNRFNRGTTPVPNG
jgi:hypothetical protein